MNILPITTGMFQEICYLAWSTENKAIVFDPGAGGDVIHETLKRHHLEVAAYVCTHTHADHIGALAELHAMAPAPVAMHSKDLEWAFGPQNRIDPYYSVPQKPDVDDFMKLDDRKEWYFADLHFQCIETPGHTPGGCCLLFPEGNMMITGDTLFKGSCGRTDLPGGNARILKESLNRLKQLPDEIRIYPGHGPDSTIGIERMTNFFMQ